MVKKKKKQGKGWWSKGDYLSLVKNCSSTKYPPTQKEKKKQYTRNSTKLQLSPDITNGAHFCLCLTLKHP